MLGRTVARAVSRGSLVSEARVEFQGNSYVIYGAQINTGTGFSPSNSVFPCQHHSTGASCELIRLSSTLCDVSS